MIKVNRNISIPEKEIELSAVRASGPGGQNVNKVASAIHLRFDVSNSSLPDYVKARILKLRDRRLSRDGVIIIKAQRYREQEKNRKDALHRLEGLVRKALQKKRKRLPTKPSRTAKRKRTDLKVRRGKVKKLRGKIRSLD
ncbi:MAG: aminoacyl-tRNA hydrolase [Xanthomonadales bacterium]|nr:aminoacyl-tRNA hydrolase [Gammaproteobacteria bacterium]NNE04622.1 aminoacyl-tRNA hydrolase [Xanthomonadales bacterium]NNL95995.1 aminoacyl-tRNA hydrolase [Xanthomonadales bacterium]